MRKVKSLILSLLILFSLTGCAEQKLLERVGLIILVGYDLGEESSLSTTAVVRQVSPEFESNIEIISAENETGKGTRAIMNRKTSKKLVEGQLRVVLYGDELASQGIGKTLNALTRDSDISGGIFVAVVEGETKKILEYSYKDIDDIGQHIYKLLEQNIEEELVISTTLHEVSHDYHSIGEDISMPILSREGESITISGMALFNKGEMVGALPATDSFYLKLVRDHYDSGTFETQISTEDLEGTEMEDLPSELSVVLDTIKSKEKLELTNHEVPEFDLDISLDARLLEVNAEIDLGDPDKVAMIEKAISKSLSSEVTRVIQYCQDVNSDVFGLGQQYRSSVKNSELTEEKWKDMYQQAKVNVQVDLNILRTGTLD